ncbi:hypothetical protein DBV15_09118 [Temnothorax longispinosus]|uniref:Uncharacterized protein n=1 Tax=Temnothorax longispinosus TaxID=300112 RepID=A0A4V3SBV9_9HYME|nr:hypothetical protein DBV15_09118 [Temnothorax longispinosus]
MFRANSRKSKHRDQRIAMSSLLGIESRATCPKKIIFYFNTYLINLEHLAAMSRRIKLTNRQIDYPCNKHHEIRIVLRMAIRKGRKNANSACFETSLLRFGGGVAFQRFKAKGNRRDYSDGGGIAISRGQGATRSTTGETTNDNRRSTARSTRSPVEFKRKEETPRVRVRSLEGASTPTTVATVGGATPGQSKMAEDEDRRRENNDELRHLKRVAITAD